MSSPEEAEGNALAKAFEKALNRHGYIFQHTVLSRINTVAAQGGAPWYVHAIEFPVESNGHQTRIDLILKHKVRSVYLLCECKRANPALADWCFAKSTHLPPGPFAYSSYYEALALLPNGDVRSRILELEHSTRIYHIGIPVKSRAEGDQKGQPRDIIEEASGQVCLGLNGFMNFLATHPDPLLKRAQIGAMPVVFTTARLWTSNVDLAAGDLESGLLRQEKVELQTVPWLFLQYHQSPGLKHDIPLKEPPDSLLQAQYQEYVRAIAIVSAAGIDDFLHSGIWQ